MARKKYKRKSLLLEIHAHQLHDETVFKDFY